MLVNDLNL